MFRTLGDPAEVHCSYTYRRNEKICLFIFNCIGQFVGRIFLYTRAAAVNWRYECNPFSGLREMKDEWWHAR